MKMTLLLSSFLLLPLHGMERTQVMMGTFATVSVEQKDASCTDSVFAAMTAVDKTLSSYDPKAEVYRLNHQGEIRISAMLYDALRKAQDYYEQSWGYFDITVGSLTRGAYRFGESKRVPGAAERKAAVLGFASLEFNATHAVLKPGAMIDLGGFGKGFGVDKGMAALRQCRAAKGAVALSGDIRCLGQCLLAVQDPFSDATLLTFETRLHETGISTSGNYRRFVGDRSHSHLIDPKTRTSEQAFASVTLIGTVSNSDLDAWTTAAAVMPLKEAERFLASLPVGYILVYNDGKIVKSANLSHYIKIVGEQHEDH